MEHPSAYVNLLETDEYTVFHLPSDANPDGEVHWAVTDPTVAWVSSTSIDGKTAIVRIGAMGSAYVKAIWWEKVVTDMPLLKHVASTPIIVGGFMAPRAKLVQGEVV